MHVIFRVLPLLSAIRLLCKNENEREKKKTENTKCARDPLGRHTGGGRHERRRWCGIPYTCGTWYIPALHEKLNMQIFRKIEFTTSAWFFLRNVEKRKKRLVNAFLFSFLLPLLSFVSFCVYILFTKSIHFVSYALLSFFFLALYFRKQQPTGWVHGCVVATIEFSQRFMRFCRLAPSVCSSCFMFSFPFFHASNWIFSLFDVHTFFSFGSILFVIIRLLFCCCCCLRMMQ